MAEYLYLACAVCGATRPLEKYGIENDGAFDPVTAPTYVVRLSRKFTGGGDRSIRWEHEHVPVDFLRALRERLSAELESIDAMLAGEGATRIRCVTCGNHESPEALGIVEDGEYDADNAPRYETGIATVHVDHEVGSFTWRATDTPVNVARGLLARLQSVAEQVIFDIAAVDQD